MIDPQPGDEGRRVIYTERADHPGRKVEAGVIISWTDRYVFVRYGNGSTAAATEHADLDWTAGAI